MKGQWNEAQKWIDRANKPGSTDNRVLFTTGAYYYWKRDYEKSTKYFDSMNPNSMVKTFYTALVNIANNKAGKAVEMLRTLYPTYGQFDGGSKALLAYALIKNGQVNEAKKILKQIEDLNQVVEYRSAACYAALGEYDKAFELLNKYFKLHGSWMYWLKYDAVWDILRNDKRYKQLLDKMPFDK